MLGRRHACVGALLQLTRRLGTTGPPATQVARKPPSAAGAVRELRRLACGVAVSASNGKWKAWRNGGHLAGRTSLRARAVECASGGPALEAWQGLRSAGDGQPHGISAIPWRGRARFAVAQPARVSDLRRNWRQAPSGCGVEGKEAPSRRSTETLVCKCAMYILEGRPRQCRGHGNILARMASAMASWEGRPRQCRRPGNP